MMGKSQRKGFMDELFLGIDLGGTNVEVGLLDEKGAILARDSFATQVELGPKSVIERMARSCEKLISKSGVSRDKVKAVGIGSPGPLSVAKGIIIKPCNLPGYVNVALRAEISSKLQIPALLNNDANVACWGEFWMGAGKDVKDMVMFTLGTGIGGGIISNGELMTGCDDNAAELGHIIIEAGGRRCGCGQLGCVEAYASANSTAARATEALDQGRPSSMEKVRKQNNAITCKDVFDHAAAGDKLANEIIDGTAKALAQVCINMLHTTEPAVIVLAGGMIKAGQVIADRVSDYFQKMVWTIKKEPTKICLAQLGGDTAIIGAAGLALDAYKKRRLCPIGQ